MRILTPYWTTKSLTSDIFGEMENIFNEATHSAAKNYYDERSFGPACEVSETAEHYFMTVDLPGMKKEDVKIELADNVLTVSGERKRERNTDANAKVQLYEKSYGFFKRSFTLPTTVEESKIEARYENGVLELYLPKTSAAKPRQIEIKSSKGGIFERLLSSDKKGDVEMKENTK
ncbi:MAG: Hsp20/alpha crystallin family protein [Bdellovibrionaceae bacterium]|nr:Hsp20/alpha crystallin family protein [Pseudobdellovibrionaceae bacterium]